MDANSFKCSVEGCGKFFKRKDRLTTHIRTHTGERPYSCHYNGCTSSYARQQHLTRHINRSHTPGYKDTVVIRCPSCSLNLANADCLKKHMERFHDDVESAHRSYQCTEEGCSESFHKKKQLVTHKLKQHSDHLIQARKCYLCPHEGCGKSFTFPSNLKHHLKIHQGYACSVEGCSQILPTWSSLRKHRAVEHMPTHSCTVCGAVFKQKSNWTQHIKIHSVSQKPHTCPRKNCGRLFLYQKNLTQHIREFHDGEAIWKNRPREKPNRSVKKQRVSRKRSLAARLCGINKDEEVIYASLNSQRHQETNENLQNSSETTVSDLLSRCTTADSGDNSSTSAKLCSDVMCTEIERDINQNGLMNSSLIRIH